MSEITESNKMSTCMLNPPPFCVIFSTLDQMEIMGSGQTNRYIACQGPLPGTCPDFWQMTWEQGSTMVVMLTTQVERGRVRASTLYFLSTAPFCLMYCGLLVVSRVETC